MTSVATRPVEMSVAELAGDADGLFLAAHTVTAVA